MIPVVEFGAYTQLRADVEDLKLQVKLLNARIDDLRAELRTEGTRRAVLSNLDRTKRK